MAVNSNGVLYAVDGTVTWRNYRTVGSCFLCGPCRGYITRSSCGYDSLEEYEVCVRWPQTWKLTVKHSPASKDANTEAEKSTALKTVTRRLQMKIQQTKKTERAVVKCGVCELAVPL
jgi:hypothetical protein